ncbi:MAG: hydrolase [Frankiales bacterium]|nr:hydrolase [Frankiales bacterium]
MTEDTFTSRSVDSAGVSVASRDFGGSGRPLVLMHGAGLTQASLQSLADLLRHDFRVVSFDFRGHGGTGRAAWTFDDAVSDLEAVIAAYGLDNPAVGGHSLGGMVGVAYGLTHPDCPGVINIDGHGMGKVEQYVGYDEAEVRQMWADHRRTVRRLTSPLVSLPLRALARLLGKGRLTASSTVRQVMQEVDALDLMAMYERLGCPLLVFNAFGEETRGGMKKVVGKGLPLMRAYRQGLGQDLIALAERAPSIEVAQLDATHMLITTHPDFVAERITAFLR